MVILNVIVSSFEFNLLRDGPRVLIQSNSTRTFHCLYHSSCLCKSGWSFHLLFLQVGGDKQHWEKLLFKVMHNNIALLKVTYCITFYTFQRVTLLFRYFFWAGVVCLFVFNIKKVIILANVPKSWAEGNVNSCLYCRGRSSIFVLPFWIA